MSATAERLHVAVGVIRNSRGEVLIARRSTNLHQGGLWEFPGGKVESGETVEQALRRELREELDIEFEGATPLKKIYHDYSDRSVLLDVWCVDSFTGEPRGLQGQPLRWVKLANLRSYEFPRANHAILTTLLLPRRMLITGDWTDLPEFDRKLEKALATGIRLVQLRAHMCDAGQYRELFVLAKRHCDSHGALLVANTDLECHAALGPAGLHLTAARLMSLLQRPVNRETWLGASCHDLSEIRQAERIGVDYITLGPVLPTQTHPGRASLGFDRLAELAQMTSVPVFGLGGLKDGDEDRLQAAGAHGLAAIRSWW